MSVMIRQNKDDCEMLDIYSRHNNQFCLWGVVHKDMLDSLNYDFECEEEELNDFRIEPYIGPRV